jgi:hypothetical protein
MPVTPIEIMLSKVWANGLVILTATAFCLWVMIEGVGVCGKDGQSVPVGVGQPTLKLDELTVGGTQ